jgi:hypothetical protein
VASQPAWRAAQRLRPVSTIHVQIHTYFRGIPLMSRVYGHKQQRNGRLQTKTGALYVAV